MEMMGIKGTFVLLKINILKNIFQNIIVCVSYKNLYISNVDNNNSLIKSVKEGQDGPISYQGTRVEFEVSGEGHTACGDSFLSKKLFADEEVDPWETTRNK